MRIKRFAGVAIVLGLGLAPATGAVRAGTEVATSGVIVTFEGGEINLAEGWGQANACFADDAGARCYRTFAELVIAEHGISEVELRSGPVLLATCASALTLYKNTSYGGQSLSLNTRGTAIGLAGYGFNNATSSYTIGACDARFYDGSSGSGLYPGNTDAFAVASSMVSGWDNTISTVYIL